MAMFTILWGKYCRKKVSSSTVRSPGLLDEILDGSVALDMRRRRDGCMRGAIVRLCLEITASLTSRREGVDLLA